MASKRLNYETPVHKTTISSFSNVMKAKVTSTSKTEKSECRSRCWCPWRDWRESRHRSARHVLLHPRIWTFPSDDCLRTLGQLPLLPSSWRGGVDSLDMSALPALSLISPFASLRHAISTCLLSMGGYLTSHGFSLIFGSVVNCTCFCLGFLGGLRIPEVGFKSGFFSLGTHWFLVEVLPLISLSTYFARAFAHWVLTGCAIASAKEHVSIFLSIQLMPWIGPTSKAPTCREKSKKLRFCIFLFIL